MDEKSQKVRKLIRRAERYMDRDEWDEVAELCYHVLALEPHNENAANKLRLVYLRDDLVREMERQMFRMFDPEDDRPHQRRHKLGFSYACLSRWEEAQGLGQAAIRGKPGACGRAKPFNCRLPDGQRRSLQLRPSDF
jgi:hypothetical protein